MANLEYENIDLGTLCLETPFTQDDVFNATDTNALAAGTILTRSGVSGKLVAAVDGDPLHAVLQYDIPTVAIGDIPMRPVIGGKVRADKCFLLATPTTALTPAQRDSLRSFGIEAVDVDELGQFNNPGA